MEIFSPLTPALQPHGLSCFEVPAWARGGRHCLWLPRDQCIFSSDSTQSEPHRVGLAVAAFIVMVLYSHAGFELSSP